MKFFKSYFLPLVSILFFVSCAVNDAKVNKVQTLYIFSDFNLKKDSTLFDIFEKKEKIKLRFVQVDSDSILVQLKKNKYNADADLLLLSNYELLKKVQYNKLFLPINSSVLSQNIDPNYRSKNNTWFALSKSPLVVIYNKNVLNKDTLKNYYELIYPKWKNKISFQAYNDFSYKNFVNTYDFLLKEKADSFLYKLNTQNILPHSGDDLEQIKRIALINSLFSVIKLSSLAESQNSKVKVDKKMSKSIGHIFANQRKKGCFITISGGGVYRYAKNPSNAIKLLEFLSSKKAQKIYAHNRFEYPVTKSALVSKFLLPYGKYRGRFYKY
jgi:iron(III) transport system substrate-binding protein